MRIYLSTSVSASMFVSMTQWIFVSKSVRIFLPTSSDLFCDLSSFPKSQLHCYQYMNALAHSMDSWFLARAPGTIRSIVRSFVCSSFVRNIKIQRLLEKNEIKEGDDEEKTYEERRREDNIAQKVSLSLNLKTSYWGLNIMINL